MSRFGRTEKIIFVVAMLVFLTMSYFLYDDSLLFSSSNNAKLTLIGTVSTSQNDVRRKNFDTFSWIPATSKDQIYENDSIFTGDRSEAELHLNEGATIKLQPNSLVTLNLKSGQMLLDLRYGNLKGEIQAGSSMIVRSDNEEFVIENNDGTPEKSQLEFAKSHSGNVEVKLNAGKATFTNKKSNAKAKLAKNKPLTLINNGKAAEIEKPALFPTTSDNLNIARKNPDDPLVFQWKNNGDIAQYEFEISPKEDFSVITTSRKTNSQKIQITDPLEPGTYFWRVKGMDNSGQVVTVSKPHNMSINQFTKSTFGEISLTQAPATSGEETPPAPTDDSAAALIPESPAVPEETPATSVAETASVPAEQEPSTPSTETPLVPKMETPTSPLAATLPSIPKVEIPLTPVMKKPTPPVAKKPRGKVKPEAPVLVTKNVEFTVPTAAERSLASAPSPQLKWSLVEKVKSYQLEISKDSNFGEAEKYEVTANETSWPQYQPGKFHYRVIARGINGLQSEPSDTGLIDVTVGKLTLSSIKPISAIGKTPSPMEAPISWTEIPFAKSYLVQMDKEQNFSKPHQLAYAVNGGKLPIATPGRYNVRVQALDKDNKPLTSFSNVEEALYTFRSPLDSPVLTEPFNNASIFLQTEMEPFIWLEWKAVKEAISYSIEISDKEDFSRILISKTMNKTRYLVKNRVPLGKIYWRVRANAKDKLETSLWAEKREFTLYHQKNETFVK